MHGIYITVKHTNLVEFQLSENSQAHESQVDGFVSREFIKNALAMSLMCFHILDGDSLTKNTLVMHEFAHC